MPEIGGVSDRKLVVSGNVPVHICLGKLRSRLTFCAVDQLAVRVILGAISMDKFINPIHPAERNMVPHHYPPLPNLMTHEGKRAVDKKSSDIL